MVNVRPYVAAVAMAAAAVVGVNGVAVAATGNSMLLGRFNYEDQPTRIITTGLGPAARFTVKAGQMPFSVNTTIKVPNLNADLVDGLDGTSLQNKAYTYAPPTVADSSTLTLNFPGLPAGTYLASYSLTALSGDGATSADCAMQQTTYELANRSAFTGSYAAASASGIVDTTGSPVTLTCFFGGGSAHWVVGQSNYSTVTFLRVDSVSHLTSTAAARPALRARTAT